MVETTTEAPQLSASHALAEARSISDLHLIMRYAGRGNQVSRAVINDVAGLQNGYARSSCTERRVNGSAQFVGRCSRRSV